MDNIVLIGSSGHARVLIDIVEKQGHYRIAGLVDSFRPPGESTSGYPVLGPETALAALIETHALRGVLVAIGDNWVRAQVSARIAGQHPELRFISAVHPAATLGRDAGVGPGSVVMAGAVLNPGARAGRGCIINTNASLDHDATLGDFASLAPRVATGGACTIGAYAAIGIGATLRHGIAIGEHAVIGAGATVLHNIGALAVAYGTPARVIRPRQIGDRYL